MLDSQLSPQKKTTMILGCLQLPHTQDKIDSPIDLAIGGTQ
jgi:hypothetical protein